MPQRGRPRSTNDVLAELMAGADAEHLRAEAETRAALARNVLRLRVAANLSQKQLAQKCEMAQPRIAEIETGRANPQLDTLARIAAALDTSPSALLSHADQIARPSTSAIRTSVCVVAMPSVIVRAWAGARADSLLITEQDDDEWIELFDHDATTELDLAALTNLRNTVEKRC